jgi:hypothetical protein
MYIFQHETSQKKHSGLFVSDKEMFYNIDTISEKISDLVVLFLFVSEKVIVLK